MTNQVILARRMNLNPNDSVKWSLMKFTNSKRFLNGPAVSSNHTSYLSINLHNPKFYLRNFYRCFTQKVYTQNVQPLPCEWKPCFTCAVLELGQASCPSPHQPFRHFRSMNWQLSKLFELDSNITQISANFLKYYTNIYTLSPGFDGLQEGLQCFKKISRKMK